MSDLAAQIREKVPHPPTVTSEGAGAAQANEWASQASAALLAVLELHEPYTITGGEFAGRKVCKSCGDTADEHLAVDDPCPTKVAIAEKLGIEVTVAESETPEQTARFRVGLISEVLHRAGLPACEMNSFAFASPFSDPVRQAGFAVCSYETDPDCVYVEWIDHHFGRAPAWREQQVMRALRDAGYTAEDPGTCGPAGPYTSHRYVRVTRPGADRG